MYPERYRVEDKRNAQVANKESTVYSMYEYSERSGGYVFVGNGFAPGFDASDQDCINDFNETNSF
jgi:hypothetical protein